MPQKGRVIRLHPLRLFDLHCDTALELYLQNQSLATNKLYIALDKAAAFSPYIQTMAVWSDCRLPDHDAWEQFFPVVERLKKELSENNVALIESADALRALREEKKQGVMLAVEDARILGGDIDRLDTLYRHGVRFLTLTWGGSTCIGGSHKTDDPLTEFGREVVERCFARGIVPDVSHASRRVTAEVLDMAKRIGRPIMATHSNAYGAYAHTRNLTDDEFSAIAETGGVVGISLVPQHLTSGVCDIGTVIRHIQHYLALGGENVLCLGCDFDGTGETPRGLSSLADLPALADALIKEGLSAEAIDKIFFENACRFAEKIL